MNNGEKPVIVGHFDDNGDMSRPQWLGVVEKGAPLGRIGVTIPCGRGNQDELANVQMLPGDLSFDPLVQRQIAGRIDRGCREPSLLLVQSSDVVVVQSDNRGRCPRREVGKHPHPHGQVDRWRDAVVAAGRDRAVDNESSSG